MAEVTKERLLSVSLEPSLLEGAVDYGKELFGNSFVYEVEELWKEKYKEKRIFPCLTKEKCNRKFCNIDSAMFHFCFVFRN